MSSPRSARRAPRSFIVRALLPLGFLLACSSDQGDKGAVLTPGGGAGGSSGSTSSTGGSAGTTVGKGGTAGVAGAAGSTTAGSAGAGAKGGTGGAGGTVATGGAAGKGGAAGSGAGTAAGGCAGSGGATTPECQAYASCTYTKCDSAYRKCYGDAYQSGVFSGPCGTYAQCTTKCCGNSACTSACGTPPSECQSCLQTSVVPCVTSTCTTEQQKCSASQGSAGSAGSGGGTPPGYNCFQLSQCCPSLPADYKAGCSQVSGGGQDATCASLLTQLKSAGYCK